MKVFVVLSVLVAVAVAAPANELDLLKSYDFDGVLNGNEEMRQKSLGCLLDKVDCGELQPIKDASILVLKNKCADCNEEQKTRYDRVLKNLQDNYGDVYNELQKKISN